jgi:hypothetical protein
MAEIPAEALPTSDRLVFVGGLHRSGTTLLAQLLAEHPDVSGLSHTKVFHDEGQFLQDLYPTAGDCGGPGHFAFHEGAHLTERDVRDVEHAREHLLESWTRFWDPDRRILVEKSPPNLVRFRYLQAVFPEALFVAIVRHPIAVSYATAGWARASIPYLIEHWLHAHEDFEDDRKKIRRLAFVRYEDLVADVEGTLARIYGLLGLPPHAPATEVRLDTNQRYLGRWRHSRLFPTHPRVLWNLTRFEPRLRRLGYGYSLRDRR